MTNKSAYILAYQRATNYGAVLQIYALKSVLEKNGINVRVIDYIPKWMQVTLKNQPGILSFIKRKIMNFTFKRFLGNLCLTDRKYYTLDELNSLLPGADYYFVGSDQVWNEKIMKKDLAYFLSFAPENSVKIGYAISMGDNNLTENFCKQALKFIEKFKYISVREKFVSEFIHNQGFNIETPIVLDPTLLLSSQDYDKISSNKIFKNDYIAVYSCMHDENLYELAKYLKFKTQLPIINLGYHFKGADKHEYLLGPDNWINRIKNAKYFITNSFHGTAFAVIYKKNFFTVPNQNPNHVGLNSRFTELLISIELSNRIVNSKQDLDKLYNQNIDFTEPDLLLEVRKKKSIGFICTCLQRV